MSGAILTIDTATTIAERLEACRLAVPGLSARGLARLAGLRSPTHVHAIEAGDVVDPGVRTVGALAEALGVNPGWLAFGVGEFPSVASIAAAVARGRST